MQPYTSYLVCATPRSGSTLLCEALTNTGLAGYPKEYFEALKDTGLPRRPREYFHESEHAEILKLLGTFSRLDDAPVHPTFSGRLSYADYLAQVIEEGTTPNGVFGTKMMWGYFGDFISNIRSIPVYKEMAAPEMLSALFPNLHYIYITRCDKVRQAVSLWKAIQTYTWKMEESPSSRGASSRPVGELQFHFGAINYLVQRLKDHEDAWQRYFDMSCVQPFTIVYEEFELTYEETAREVLHYLHIPVPEKLVFAERRMKRQADSLSQEWVERYYCLKQGKEDI